MKVKFFIYMNDEVNQTPEFIESDSIVERTRKQLAVQLELLTKMVETAADSSKDILPVVFCAEDFFQGGEISSDEELYQKTGQCFDRNTAYEFITTELKQLSAKFPRVLIVPGSMYVGVLAENDSSEYKQNGYKRKATLYTQNIAPVLHNGQVIRLLKKGGYLVDKTLGCSLFTSEDHLISVGKSSQIAVPFYNEDSLEDINAGLIHMGKTPLPNESECLEILRMEKDELFSPVFVVNGLNFGLEICGDHARTTLAGEHLDFHLITTNGIGWSYNACGENGYRVQADAESRNLTSVATVDFKTLLPLKSFAQSTKCPQHQETDALPVLRHEYALDQLVKLISDYALRAPQLTGGMFKGKKPRPFRDCDTIIDNYKKGQINIKSALEEIISISERMGKNHPIKVAARDILNMINAAQIDSSQAIKQLTM